MCSDLATLQSAIDRLRHQCKKKKLHLNLDKCALLTICKGSKVIQSKYQYGDYEFKRVTEKKDLGIIIDHSLKFAKHIDAITSKVTAALSFVNRFCNDIGDSQTLKRYCNLILSTVGVV